MINKLIKLAITSTLDDMNVYYNSIKRIDDTYEIYLNGSDMSLCYGFYEKFDNRLKDLGYTDLYIQSKNSTTLIIREITK